MEPSQSYDSRLEEATVACGTAAEFLDELRAENFPGTHPWECGWYFRGQQRASWDLLASAWRQIDNVIQRLARHNLQNRTRRHTETMTRSVSHSRELKEAVAAAVAQARAEVQLLDRFCRTANAVGHVVPDSERLPHAYFYRWAELLLNPDEEAELWDSTPAFVALAQHHGVPTRLVDLTRRPDFAALFAATGVTPEDADYRIAVWAIEPSGLFSAPHPEPGTFVSHEPPLGSVEFLRAQQGLFARCVQPELFYSKHQRWPELSRYLLTEYDAQSLRRFTLPASQAGELLQTLSKRGISRAHLMPTFDNIARTAELEWRWSSPGLLPEDH